MDCMGNSKGRLVWSHHCRQRSVLRNAESPRVEGQKTTNRKTELLLLVMLFDGTKHFWKNQQKTNWSRKNTLFTYTRYNTLYTGRFPLFAEFDPFFTKRYSLNATILTQENSLHVSNYRSKRWFLILGFIPEAIWLPGFSFIHQTLTFIDNSLLSRYIMLS